MIFIIHKKQTPCAHFKLVLIWSVFTLVLHTTINTIWHGSNNFDKFIFIATVIVVRVKCVQHGVDHKHIEHLFDVCLCVWMSICVDATNNLSCRSVFWSTFNIPLHLLHQKCASVNSNQKYSTQPLDHTMSFIVIRIHRVTLNAVV